MQRSLNIDTTTNELEYVPIDFDDPQALLEHAKKLEGHTFREVLDLGITPDGPAAGKTDYNDASFKGGMGTLDESDTSVTTPTAMRMPTLPTLA